MQTAHIQKLFNPKSVAVIGASRSKKKVGGVILANLLADNNKLRIYPVNPNTYQVQGEKTYDSIIRLPEVVDVAVIAVPSVYVDNAVEECALKGVKNIIIISAGYAETGHDGLIKELQLRKLQKKYQLNILGPNCLGIINARTNVNLSFADTPHKFSKGKIALISQSGAVGTAFLDWAKSKGIEISKFVSLGNKIDLSENDFLEYFEDDKETDVILLYIENFQDGRKFYELAKKITTKKPIIVLKPGKNETTSQAMVAHTGSIATNDKIVEQALKDSGCIRVDSIEDLFNITKLLVWQPVMKGNNVAVITNAGGVAIDTIDQLSNYGLTVNKLPESIQEKLSKVLKPNASSKNPVDLLGDALAEDYKQALLKIVKSKDVDIIFVILTPQLMTESLQTAKFVNEIADKNKKIVVTSFVGGENIKKALIYLDKAKIPQFEFPSDGARVLGEVWGWRSSINKVRNSRLHYPTVINPSLKAKPGEMLSEELTKKLLDKYNINYLESWLFDSVKEIRKVEEKLQYPLVVKLKHPELVHKSDVKAVKLPIYKQTELYAALKELQELGEKLELKDFQFEIQHFIFQKLELILGVKKDPDQIRIVDGTSMTISKGFGHIVILGAGGIYTELLDDSAMKLFPVNKADALTMIKSIKVGEILLGARSQQYNYQSLLKMIVNLSKLIEKNANITAIDINPVFVTEHDAYAADVKIFV